MPVEDEKPCVYFYNYHMEIMMFTQPFGLIKFSRIVILTAANVLNDTLISTKAPKLPSKGKATVELHRNILYELCFKASRSCR